MTQVKHSQFGIGTITFEDNKKIVVMFESGEKTLSAVGGGRLVNMDGTPYGKQVEVKAAKRTNCQKMMAWEKTLTQEDRNRLEFKNADGSTDYIALDAWEQKRKRLAWESIGE